VLGYSIPFGIVILAFFWGAGYLFRCGLEQARRHQIVKTIKLIEDLENEHGKDPSRL
jgi:hypothetical protein